MPEGQQRGPILCVPLRFTPRLKIIQIDGQGSGNGAQRAEGTGHAASLELGEVGLSDLFSLGERLLRHAAILAPDRITVTEFG